MKTDLDQKHCKPCEGEMAALTQSEIQQLLPKIPGWQLEQSDKDKIPFLARLFEFKNYYHTMAFVNMVAWLAHRENHHPDLEVSYNRVKVRFFTHALKGLSENDFISAAKLNALIEP